LSPSGHGDIEESFFQGSVFIRMQRRVVTQCAFVQDRHPIAHGRDFGQLVGGQDDCCAAGRQFTQ
jgi:hypothetical protein